MLTADTVDISTGTFPLDKSVKDLVSAQLAANSCKGSDFTTVAEADCMAQRHTWQNRTPAFPQSWQPCPLAPLSCRNRFTDAFRSAGGTDNS